MSKPGKKLPAYLPTDEEWGFLFLKYPEDEQRARQFLIQKKYGDECPECRVVGHLKVYGNYVHCNRCLMQETVRKDTIFAESQLPVWKWYRGIWLYQHVISLSAKHLGQLADISPGAALRMMRIFKREL